MIRPPSAKKIPYELTFHGHTRIDNYYWLNQREDPEVIDYLNAENNYTEAMMADTELLQKNLYNEIVGRIKQTDLSVPYFLNGYYYYVRYEEEKEYPIYCRKKNSLNGLEELLLDVNIMARDQSYYEVAGIHVRPDNRMFSFGVDITGRRIYTIYFKDLVTGNILDETIEGTSGNADWANDNKTVFFASKDKDTLRPDKIFRYRIQEQKSPVLVYEEKDEIYSAYVYKSRSRQYIIIGLSANMSDEYRILSADNPEADFRIFQQREHGVEYSIGHFGDSFYIRTNLDAPNFRLMKTPVDSTEKEFWEEVIAHREDVLLEDFLNFNHYMVVEERIKGNVNFRIINMQTSREHYVDFGEEVYNAWLSINPEFTGDLLRLGYSSLTTPASTYDYHMEHRQMTLLKQQEIVGGYNHENYKSERRYATSYDGTLVPISLVYKKSTMLDGSSPLLLYGYGSYGITIDPNFSSARLSLLDRGFIFAIAHIRGGQFLGRMWYEKGKKLTKKNTFDDFIACAQHLVNNHFTSTDKMMAMGGSAGGLLMGAVINMNPVIFKGIVAAVPFVDVLTTMLDDNIPLTTGEYDEWGNPSDREFYNYMLSYSPYDNVECKEYPNILVTAGLHDSQVQYWEPAKWVAKLRDMKIGDNLLLLHINMDAGHGGASGRFKQFRETALEYAFLLKLAGITK